MISPKVANTLQGSLAVAFCSSTKRNLQGPSNTIHIEIKKSRPLIGQACQPLLTLAVMSPAAIKHTGAVCGAKILICSRIHHQVAGLPTTAN